MTTEQKPPKADGQKLKKSETLEVRIPHETKQAFLTACREDGTTASEVVRDKVQSYLDERERPQTQPREALIMKFPETVRRYGPRVAASGVAAVVLATFAVLPSAAAPDFQAQFRKLDANGDGVVTAEEYAAPHKIAGTDDKADEMVVATRIQRSGGAAPPANGDGPKSETKQDAFTFWLPDELGGDKTEQNREYRYSTSTIVRIEKDDPGAKTDGSPPEPPAPPQVFNYEDMRKSEFAGIDTDKDGKVSFAEYQKRQTAMLTRGFEMLDVNGDKALTQAEYDKIGVPPMPRLGAADGTDREQMVQVIVGGPKFTDGQLKAAFTKLDANKDKKVSLQEYLPPA